MDYLKSKNLQFIKLLGKGSFSEVILVEHIISKRQYAIKILSQNKSQLSFIESEIQILKSLSHPNIIKYFNVLFNENKVYIVMEYIQGGTICINSLQNEEQKRLFFKHLILAVQYLHQNNIIHCDLKLENILISIPGDYTSIKIIDFGLSFKFQENEQKIQYIQSSTRQFGTPYFMAPELFNNAIYSKEIDIWSCGIILYMLEFNGQHPFIEQQDKLADVKKKLKNPVFKRLNYQENQIGDLIKKITKAEPEQRYTINQILMHPWITCENKIVKLTAYEIRQSFTKQQTLKSLINAMLFIKYVDMINTKYAQNAQKFKIIIKAPQKKEKHETLNEIISRILQKNLYPQINYKTTCENISPYSQTSRNSLEDLNQKNITFEYMSNSCLKLQLQKTENQKTKRQKPNIWSSDSLTHLQTLCQKQISQQRQNSCITLPQINQTKHSLHEFSQQISNNINSARISIINQIKTRKQTYPCQKSYYQQQFKESQQIKGHKILQQRSLSITKYN